MNTTQLPRHKPSPLEGVLALLATVLVFATLSLNETALHLSYRETLVLLLLIGYALCHVAKIHDRQAQIKFSFGHRLTLSLLGIMSAIFVVAHLFGFDLPMVKDDRQALVMLAATMLVKWMVTAGQRMAK
ncbi:MAG: hypothetical protein HZB52_07760 [Chloroflexi bacterium]|nr:hypothetical protein [Chloroflexota bacterium]